MKRRRFLIPEAIQASGMDCGPASLKALLEGFGIHASYGRLREACQTDVDGSSIDTIEEVARKLGLDAEQIMVPPDHLLLSETTAIPGIVVVRLPNGTTHFVVVWRRHGRLLQLMDPATGRRWVTWRRFLEEIYVHTATVPAEDWRAWAGSEMFQATLCRRLRKLGVRRRSIIEAALADVSWRKLAAADAGVRLLQALVRSGAVRRGRQAVRLLEGFLAQDELIPDEFWAVRPAGTSAGPEQLRFRGAVLVRVRGRLAGEAPERFAELSPELAAALREKPLGPARELLRLLRADGLFAPSALTLVFLLAAGAVMLEAVLFRGLFDLGSELELSGQRLGAMTALVSLLLLLLLLELPVIAALLRMGRHLETRLRMAFLEKIPRLSDRYFKSRLKSDMTERSHMIYRIRRLPEMGGKLLRNVFEVALTAAGIAWIDAKSAPLAAAAAASAVALPLVLQPIIGERDLRIRSHTGALCRYYLDALLGLVPIRVHGAERALHREHSKLLAEWAGAGFALQRVVVWAEAAQFTVGFGLAAVLLAGHLTRNPASGTVLLLAYWALNLPVLGQDIASIAWQYPAYRNTMLRLMEPLGALEEESAFARSPLPDSQCSDPAAIAFENVTVRAGGHTILEKISFAVPAGAHIALVGPSGAGKSSVAGTLLGFWRPASGRVLVDGRPIEERLEELRRATAWVDPEVHIWNRTFAENIRYGAPNGGGCSMTQIVESAELRRVLERLPEGFETLLGEGGALVSGGEGQRVRLARALFRPNTRLVILDEAFRGLDREQRRELLSRARRLWREVTLLCITHDLQETLAFERVLVIENGTVAEDGNPAVLAAQPGSRYRELLEAERALQRETWSGSAWRRLRLEDGLIRTVLTREKGCA